MSSWQQTTLGAVCEAGGGGIQTGPFGSQLHAADYVEFGVPSVMPQNIGENRIVEAGIARITEFDAARLSKYRLATDDIVYSRRGDVERRALVRPENDGWLCGTGCLKVSFGDAPVVDPAFISYFLGTPSSREWIVQHAVGATMLNLNTKILQNVPIRIPTLAEQRTIAEVLSALDDKIAANNKIAVCAENLALTLLHGQSASVSLSEIVTHKRKSVMPIAFGTPTVAHFSLPAFDAGKLHELCPPEEIKSNKFHVQAPSVLISKLNPRFPRVWNLSNLPIEPAMASTEFLVLEPKYSSASVLWATLSQEKFGRDLEAKVAGTSGSHQRVTPADLLATKALDPRSLGAETHREIDALSNASFQARYENHDLTSIRDALLPPLMSGKLQVKDAEAIVAAAV